MQASVRCPGENCAPAQALHAVLQLVELRLRGGALGLLRACGYPVHALRPELPLRLLQPPLQRFFKPRFSRVLQARHAVQLWSEERGLDPLDSLHLPPLRAIP